MNVIGLMSVYSVKYARTEHHITEEAINRKEKKAPCGGTRFFVDEDMGTAAPQNGEIGRKTNYNNVDVL